MRKSLSPYLRGAILCLVGMSQIFPARTAASEKVLHNFISYPSGATPFGTLVADAAGNLYGTTEFGGAHGYGAVFKLTFGPKHKIDESVIYSFKGYPTDGGFPLGGVTFDKSGNLYGSAGAGRFSAGVVYKLSSQPSGKWTEAILYEFGGYDTDGAGPSGPLTFDAAGNIYGTTIAGGAYGEGGGGGTVFELTPSQDGWAESILYSFKGIYGPQDGIILDDSGRLYGTAQGHVFRLTYDPQVGWTESVLCSCPFAGALAFGRDGNLYGNSRTNGSGSVFELKQAPQDTWTFITLYTFNGGTDGYGPSGSIVFDEAGILYGSTSAGGVPGTCGGLGCGTVYKLSQYPDGHWEHTVIYTFKSDADGAAPQGLLAGKYGTLYGATANGGDVHCVIGTTGCGTVFALTSSQQQEWQKHEMVTFHVGDGQRPPGSLISDSRGNLYGVALLGGEYNGGIAYKLTPEPDGRWQETILHSFGGTGDGTWPSGSLILDDFGNLYGVTSAGGKIGYGGVFELTPDPTGMWVESLIYSFAGYPNDGATPIAGLIADGQGNLYGTTEYGGGGACFNDYYEGCGTVFQLSPAKQGSWAETVLHSFAGYPADGYAPVTTLAVDQNNNLYGSTSLGGGDKRCADNLGRYLGCGTLFELSFVSGTWTESQFYAFSQGSSRWGVAPSALVSDENGSLYGTTANDGAYGGGTFYHIKFDIGQGWLLRRIYEFGGYPGDGLGPNGVILDGMGNAYGTTGGGGNSSACAGCGTVFQISRRGDDTFAERVLYSFKGPFGDGKAPTSGITLGSSQNLFGVTEQGGLDYNSGAVLEGGTVFELAP